MRLRPDAIECLQQQAIRHSLSGIIHMDEYGCYFGKQPGHVNNTPQWRVWLGVLLPSWPVLLASVVQKFICQPVGLLLNNLCQEVML